ncbi:MAG: hypothetical protein R2881_02410 [Eubacteriales bacterium]
MGTLADDDILTNHLVAANTFVTKDGIRPAAVAIVALDGDIAVVPLLFGALGFIGFAVWHVRKTTLKFLKAFFPLTTDRIVFGNAQFGDIVL